ncbi:allophanate hydrolase [Azonexus fungiphilus]|uniref:Allophanate hydrolase n=1 Tax=Azonexus fungiphilus TaxID=146940 RepID=A0A495WGJ3_9RHOO|nr:biotin-dependent carboxyltransferase family protein [Azonexus fungiphilus]RKT60821.1 allophanate hydrolase [Azonexus fungiphilus]
MNASLEVIDGGLGNTLQDRGRHGYRHLGVATSGFLDPQFAACANALAGNPDDAAAIEIRGIGPTLKAIGGPLRIALCGEIEAQLLRHGGSRQTLAPWHSATLAAGDIVKCGAVGAGTAYLAVSGGFTPTPQLGSRSTYQRANIGGIAGRPLAAGDSLPCTRLAAHEYREFRNDPWRHADGPVHVIAGPQADHFAYDALQRFAAAVYTVSRDSDRMGMRLAGPVLQHRSPAHADIVSDAVTPGCIQVPGNGLPIILLADCQTVGGYPKIATVIGADLGRLAQCRPGDELRFASVDLATAGALRRAEEDRLARWRQGIGSYLPAGYLDETALYQSNLISGAVRAEPPIRD